MQDLTLAFLGSAVKSVFPFSQVDLGFSGVCYEVRVPFLTGLLRSLDRSAFKSAQHVAFLKKLNTYFTSGCGFTSLLSFQSPPASSVPAPSTSLLLSPNGISKARHTELP